MVTAVRFVNCQAFADTTMSFSQDKLNVIIADNSEGKSIFFKLLKITACPNYYSREERKHLIRYGKDQAIFIYSFDDGSVGMTCITPSQVIYRYQRPDEEMYSYTEPPEEMIYKFGLIVDRENNFIANIVDTDQDMLLVNSNRKGNYELMKLLAENDTLQGLLLKTTELVSTFSDVIRNLSSKKFELEDQLKSYSYSDIPKIERDIKYSEMLLDTLDTNIELVETLELIQVADSVDYDNLLTLVNIVSKLEVINECLDSIEIITPIDSITIHLVNQLVNLNQIVNSIQCVAKINNKIFNSISNIIDFYNVLLTIEAQDTKNLNNLEDSIQLLENLQCIQNNLSIYVEAEMCLQNTTEEMKQLKSELLKAGKEVDCPIYGKVVFDGKKCVDSSIRPS